MKADRQPERSRWYFFAGAACLLFTLVVGTGLEAQPSKRLPVPTSQDRSRSEELIRDVFGKDLAAAQDAAAKIKLAGELFRQAKESRTETADRYVLFDWTRKLAVEAGDFRLALAAAEETAHDFEVPALSLKAQTLADAAKNLQTKEAGRDLIDLIRPLLHQAVEADDYPVALELCRASESAAARTGNDDLQTAAAARTAEVQAVQKSFARLRTFIDRLKQNPRDPTANAELGRYYALLKGRWDKALPLLAMGGDKAVAQLAGVDLDAPKEAAARLALADGWWHQADSLEGPEKLQVQRRATYWYEKALPDLAGLNRTKALRRMDRIAAKLAGTTVGGPSGPVGELKKLEGHDGDVKGLALSPDGRYGISSSTDKSVRLWDLASGKAERVLREHSKEVWGAAYHPAGGSFFTASWDATCRQWDARGGKEIRRFTHPKDINSVAVSRDGSMILCGCDDGSSYLWNVATGEQVRRFPGHTNFVYGVAIAPDGRHVASGSVDRTVRIHDLSTGQLVRTLEGFTDPVTNVAFSADGRHVFACGGTAVGMWEIATGKETRRFEGHQGRVLALAVTPDGRRLISGGDDRVLRLWDVATGKELEQLKGHTDAISGVAVSANGRLALSGGYDRTVRLWGLPLR